MASEKLKTAVLGLDGKGKHLLDAALTLDSIEIVAVADINTNLAEKIAAQHNCKWYDDYRQLVIQNQLDCLLVAAPLHSCHEYLKIAIKKKFNIFKAPPLARDFTEAAELSQLAKDNDIKFAVASPLLFSQACKKFTEAIRQQDSEQAFLVTAICDIKKQFDQPWQKDPRLAGGGVLLNHCYDIINVLAENFDLPQQVYAVTTSTAGDRQQRLYIAEDTAVVTIKFNEHQLGSLIVAGTAGSEQSRLTVVTNDQTITLSPNVFQTKDAGGNTIDHQKFQSDDTILISEQLRNFVSAIINPDQTKLTGSAHQNLKTMAIIEAAYLSARTAMPEEPARILSMTPLTK